MLDSLRRHHTAHIGAAAGVTHIAGTAAYQHYRAVARHLQTLHQTKRHKVSDVQTIGCGIKANVKGGFSVIDQFLDLLLIGHLGNQAAGNQLIINVHFIAPFHIKILCPPQDGQRTNE